MKWLRATFICSITIARLASCINALLLRFLPTTALNIWKWINNSSFSSVCWAQAMICGTPWRALIMFSDQELPYFLSGSVQLIGTNVCAIEIKRYAENCYLPEMICCACISGTVLRVSFGHKHLDQGCKSDSIISVCWDSADKFIMYWQSVTSHFNGLLSIQLICNEFSCTCAVLSYYLHS